MTIKTPQNAVENDACWNALQDRDWVQKWKTTPQDPIYHAEGNVHVHTKMVLDALCQDPQWQQAPITDRKTLWLAALLHDVAKPYTTLYKEKGRIGHPGHSRKGAIHARSLLYEMGIPMGMREEICGIIKYHQLPFWLIQEDNSENRLVRLSWQARAQLVSTLAKADIDGRICPDVESVHENIALFSLLAEEHNIHKQAQVFPDAHTRFGYFQGRCASTHDEIFDDTWGEVILMCGLPGSGKDTWIEKNLDLPIISLDALRRAQKVQHNDRKGQDRIRHQAIDMSKEFLRKKQSFVWNATNLYQKRRTPLIDLMVRYGARVRVVYIETPYTHIFTQNKDRPYPIPEGALRTLIKKVEMPTFLEAHHIDYHCQDAKIKMPFCRT